MIILKGTRLCTESPAASNGHPALPPVIDSKEKDLQTYGGNILLRRLHNLYPQGSDRFAYTDL